MDYVSSSIRSKFTVVSKAAFNGVLCGHFFSPDAPHHPTLSSGNGEVMRSLEPQEEIYKTNHRYEINAIKRSIRD